MKIVANLLITPFAILVWSLAMISCGSESNGNQSTDPSNLKIDIQITNDNSGKVTIVATAMNTVAYEYNLGDNSDPIRNASGRYEHVYENSGSYLVRVRAYGASERFVTAEERIIVNTENPVDNSEGYNTPLEYEGMELVWNDEFNSPILNASNWSYDIGTGCPDLCGWGNNELEYYREENCYIEDGNLILEARKENFGEREYTSGKVVTRDKQGFQYGRIDIRAVLPKGQGIWPALWMLGTNQRIVGWPKCGEIDIMEMIGGNGREKTVSANAFWDSDGVTDMPKRYTLDSGFFYDAYHVFSIVWNKQKITWYVDDVEYHSLDISLPELSEFHNPFYIILNVAVGGNWPGSPDDTTFFPTQMRVDYIRVFQDL